MSSHGYKPGDVVQLLSGGEPWTVLSVCHVGDEAGADIFRDGKAMSVFVPVAALRPCAPALGMDADTRAAVVEVCRTMVEEEAYEWTDDLVLLIRKWLAEQGER